MIDVRGICTVLENLILGISYVQSSGWSCGLMACGMRSRLLPELDGAMLLLERYELFFSSSSGDFSCLFCGSSLGVLAWLDSAEYCSERGDSQIFKCELYGRVMERAYVR